jgi:hypothetical protein
MKSNLRASEFVRFSTIAVDSEALSPGATTEAGDPSNTSHKPTQFVPKIGTFAAGWAITKSPEASQCDSSVKESRKEGIDVGTKHIKNRHNSQIYITKFF